MRPTTVFFDLETGGLEKDHPIIQLAAVAVRDWKELAFFERKIKFDAAKCDPKALTLNGFDPEAWTAEARPEAEVMRSFNGFLEEFSDLTLLSKKSGRPYTIARLAGHNIQEFDVPHLRRAMDRAGVSFMKGCWWYPLDSYQRALWYFAERPTEPAPVDYKVQTLAKHFGIPPQGAEHEALADVRLSALVAMALTTGEVAPRLG